VTRTRQVRKTRRRPAWGERSDTCDDLHWKHVLLPMWSLTYRFRDKAYPVLIHGQTGKVVGDAPYSWVKILVAVVGVVALGLLVAVLRGELG
jgi:hypothetical protein